jgi:hypothetical protein
MLLLHHPRETTEGLGRLIAKELKPGLAEHVDLSEEESAFTGVASQCLSVLVLGINTHLDGCLQVTRIQQEANGVGLHWMGGYTISLLLTSRCCHLLMA